MTSLTTSIIIPTYRRPLDLRDCLHSIREQSVLPLEVIVMDNDPEQTARASVGAFEARFQDLGIALRYKDNIPNSLPCARNQGVRMSHGDIVVFLDDDLVLEKEFLAGLLEVYETEPKAVAVQGYIVNTEQPSRFYRRLFYMYDVRPDTCRVWPSLRNVYPFRPSRVMPCEWLAGGCSSFRRPIVEAFPHDEKLMRYSFGEDVDQSLRLGKHYPDGLWLTPFARCLHKDSAEGRVMGRESIYTVEVYGLYLFYKLFPPTFQNIAIYWWCAFGRLLGRVRRLFRGEFKALGCQLGAFWLCWRNLQDIKDGRLDFFDRMFSKAEPSS